MRACPPGSLLLGNKKRLPTDHSVRRRNIFSALPLLLPVFPVSHPCRPQTPDVPAHLPRLTAAQCPDTSISIRRINRFPYNGGIPVRVTRSRFHPDCSQVMASLLCCSLAPPGGSLKALCIGSPVLFLALAFYDSVILYRNFLRCQ